MLNAMAIKARPHDLDAMMEHRPSFVEFHYAASDLDWMPTKKYGVPFAIHLPEFLDGNLLDCASLDEKKREMAQEFYVRAIRRGVALAPSFEGRPKIVFHPGGFHPEGSRPDDPGKLLQALAKTVSAMQEAAGGDAEILIENLPASCWFYGGSWTAQIMTTGQGLASFCTNQGIGCTLDLCHLHLAMAAHGKLDEAVNEIFHALPFVRHVHYSDAQAFDAAGHFINKEGVQIGEGDMPIAEYFDALRLIAEHSKMKVYAVPEIWFGHENNGVAFTKAWELLKEVTRTTRV